MNELLSEDTGFTVPLSKVAEEFSLELLTPSVEVAGKKLTQPNINRPALQLAGFFDFFDNARLQVIGQVEYTYLQKLNDNFRQENLRKIFQSGIPGIVLCRGLGLFPEMPSYAQKYDVPVFSTLSSTSDFISEIIRWMKYEIAPRISVHGVLLDVYGVGILIMGESGVGKSETALELIKRGHRFVADDAVEIRRASQQTLVGSCPENIRYFLELRGIGIIDIKQMFGVQSIKTTQNIDLVIKLELWDQHRKYDRIGQNDEFTEILGNKVRCHSIPIRPGRSLAIICEAAAINTRERQMGYNAAQALHTQVMTFSRSQ
jgi:HPr kinase/phosphorylase